MSDSAFRWKWNVPMSRQNPCTNTTVSGAFSAAGDLDVQWDALGGDDRAVLVRRQLAERLVPVRVALGAASLAPQQHPLGGHPGGHAGRGDADQSFR